MNLLSFPTLVEAPFIIVKIGNYTFGKYSSKGEIAQTGIPVKVMYPNYMHSINVTKINGAVNIYTIKMIYAITEGDDPNFFEKVFGSVSKTRKITISYGDWNSPSFIYREETAIITKVQSSVDFSGSSISYTISCTSDSLSLRGNSYNFPAYKSKKPSDVIWQLLNNKSYGLTNIFTGMRDLQKVKKQKLIANNDKAVTIEAKNKVNILDYLNYLVNCMVPLNTTGDSTMSSARYYLTIVDDIKNALNGSYFKVTPVIVGDTTTSGTDIFEADIGYPSNNLVTSFSLNNDESWAILYNYSEKLNQSEYTYRLNDDGALVSEYSPNLITSATMQTPTQALKTWWSNMTQFPITATMTLKGLVRPAILMSKVKVNVYFYGQKHIASGIYIITKQVDTVDSSGYKTVLTLTRIGGDKLK